MISIGILSAFVAVLAWCVYNILCKKSAPHIGMYTLAVVTMSIGLIPMVLALFITGISWPGTYQLALSVLAGIFLAAGTFLYFRAIESQQLTSVVAFGEIQPAILTIFGVFVLGEAITKIDVLSILLIFGGAFFVISTVGLKINMKLVPALLANISWTIYWLIMSEAVANTSGFTLQVTTSRAVAVILMALMLYFVIGKQKRSFKPRPHTSKIAGYTLIAFIAIAGIFDGLGDLVFTFTLNSNIVAVGGAITALSPVIISALSYFIFKDRLTKVQGIGLAIMILGALALSIG